MRRAGILLPLFSLPSPWGIGTLGKAAFEFVDFLSAAGQSCWQLLPLGPTGYGDSPYQSCSAYAGNPYFVDLDLLQEQGLLCEEEYASLNWGDCQSHVDYQRLWQQRIAVLRRASARLDVEGDAQFQQFCNQQADWLQEYALYMALKGAYDNRPWFAWPQALRKGEPAALAHAQTQFSAEILFWKQVQFLFFQQWRGLKQYANAKGISIIGDMPIYVAADSADVWANPAQFQLDETLHPTYVAGCPPDYFSPHGQLWGNPLYNWEYMRQDGYRWWLRLLRAQVEKYDLLRIDHFRGFESYYCIPFGEETAENGHWQQGPKLEFFQVVEKQLGKQDIIAEDLGALTPAVHKLRQDAGFVGMKVLQFAFSDREHGSTYLPHCCEPDCVVYTGTHDNDTILGWVENGPINEVEYAKEYLRLTAHEGYHWGMMRGAWGCAAKLVIIPMQDVLGLDTRARINTPSTLGENWRWRMLRDACTPALAQKLRHDMGVYQRLPRDE